MSHMARFSIIPGWIVTDPRLKGNDLRVLCLLGRHTDKHGWCRRSQVKMAQQLGCARSTVQAALDRLGELGVVEKHVEESRDGRDSAHSYRVIYDAPPPEGYAFSAWDEPEDEEENPIIALSGETPPAGIPAPPADPESAPPADPGPAPINDPYLTTPSERKERESPGEREQGEDHRKVERDFKRWYPTWPSYVSDSQPAAMKAWEALSADEREQAAASSEAYVAAVKASGRKFLCSAGIYLTEKRWEKLPKSQSLAKPPQLANAYSRAWMGLHFAGLAKAMRRLSLTPLEERIIEAEPGKRTLLWADKCRKHGWPEVSALHERAREFKGVMVAPSIAQAAERCFDKVHVGGALWEAWKRLHDAHNWPFPPQPDKLEFVQFPSIGADEDDLDAAVERALTRFWAEIRTGGARDDAA